MKHNLERYEQDTYKLKETRSELMIRRERITQDQEISNFIREWLLIQDDSDMETAFKLDEQVEHYAYENQEEIRNNKIQIDQYILEVKDYMFCLRRNIESAKRIPEGYGNEYKKYIDDAKERCRRIEEILKSLSDECDSLDLEDLAAVRQLSVEYGELKNTMTVERFAKSQNSDLEDSTLVDIRKLLDKERLSDTDRANIRKEIQKGRIGECELRMIGSKVREKYDQMVSERNREYDDIYSKKRELAKRIEDVGDDEIRVLKQREQKYRDQYSKLGMLKQLLQSYRELGPEKNDKGQLYESGFWHSSSEVIESINSIREYLPTDWVIQSNEIPIITKHVRRGYFNIKDGKPTIALSSSGRMMQRCAFHEMGHLFESMYPEIRKIEYQFYNRRTEGEKLKWLGGELS